MSDSFLGIDLGTTNSVASLLVPDKKGDTKTHVRTDDGGFLLPSVVRLDARGNALVGARARKFLETDPENTRGEFKRLMGSGRKLAFKSAKIEKSPEELSALVLGSLADHAAQVLGKRPTCAVVTVPALFELPQIRATSEAARLAGFERVEHLQEPVASALTAGHDHREDAAPWFVYDLGGGTFDVSLLETREGVLRVIDHDGDNFLGGRDMDARLLEHVLGVLEETYKKPFKRADPALATALRRLRPACEEAKMELGRGKPASVSLAEPVVVGGEEIVIDVPLDVSTFESLVMPTIDRSVDVCLRLLARQGLDASAVGRLVLVGGPTVMPCLRTRLEERLGIVLAADIDPMTAVAEGAALFARERGLVATSSSAQPAARSEKVAAEKLWLQFPSVSGDAHPFVVGRAAPERVASVQATRRGDAWKSAEEKIGEDGTFALQVELASRTTSTFDLAAKDPAGKSIAVTPAEISIRHGLSLADPPLARTIGIALANGGVAVYFERGAPLPSKKTFRLRTSLTILPGETASAIRVPIVQGEAPLAHLCRLVGFIELRPDALTTTLPAGSALDVVLEVDRGGKLSATAEIAELGLRFDGVLLLVSPDAPIEELEGQLGRLRKKTETLYASSFVDAAQREALVGIDGRLDDAAREAEAARGADPDAIEKLRRLLVDVDEALADVEAKKAWPELEQSAMNRISFAMQWVARNGTDSERRLLDEAIRSVERARSVRNAADFERRVQNVVRIGEAAWLRDSGELTSLFRRIAQRLPEMHDPREANKLVAKGEAAIARGDHDDLRRTTYALLDKLPPREQVRIRAHGSGVEQ